MALPPAHSVDHTPQVILSFDDAWDMEAVDAERDALPQDQRDSHPWMLYHQLEARSDLSTVRGYLLADATPWVFELRRLTMREIATVEARAETSSPAARNLALALALVDVEGVEIKFARGSRKPHTLTDDDLEKLRALVSDVGIRELGNHAMSASRLELTEPEKKL